MRIYQRFRRGTVLLAATLAITLTAAGAGYATGSRPAPEGSPPPLSREVLREVDRVLWEGRLDESGITITDVTRYTPPEQHAVPSPPGGGGYADPSTQEVFDIALFERNIRDTMDGQTVGYAYSIGSAGVLASQGAWGAARTAADAPQLPQSAVRPMTVASVSKSITAVLALRVLAEYGISVDNPIGPWLPSTWERGTGVDEITFRDLMTHTSGLRQSYETATGKSGKVTGAYDNIRIAVGEDLGSTSYAYANMNFSIFRILVPQIRGYDSALYENVSFLPEGYHEALTAVLFDIEVREMLNSVGIDGGCEPSGADPTVLYRFPYLGDPGWQTGSYLLGCGGYGLYLSANGLTSFLSHLRYTDELLTPAQRAQLTGGLLGLKRWTGQHGTYTGHDGQWKKGAGGMDGCALSFSIHVDASLLINSRVGDYPLPCSILRDAFDDAWVAP